MLFIGAQVKSRILLWGLTAAVFILTLAFSSWHEGLWRSDAARATRAAPQHHNDSFVPRAAHSADHGGESAVPDFPPPHGL
jgi:hypothetical protein